MSPGTLNPYLRVVDEGEESVTYTYTISNNISSDGIAVDWNGDNGVWINGSGTGHGIEIGSLDTIKPDPWPERVRRMKNTYPLVKRTMLQKIIHRFLRLVKN